VKNSSEYLFDKLKELKSDYEIITQVRGIGLMIGIVFDYDSKTIQSKLLENGLLTTICGDNVIRILPPLIIKKEEIDKAIDIFSETLEKLES
jgi:4-aminobutyrate aminotransferase-like enzyme